MHKPINIVTLCNEGTLSLDWFYLRARATEPLVYHVSTVGKWGVLLHAGYVLFQLFMVNGYAPLTRLIVEWASWYSSWASRYVKLRIVHAPGMPGTFSPPLTSKETASTRSRHAPRHVRDARAVMHVGIANPRWWGKRSRHSRHMRNPKFYLSGKRPMQLRYLVTIF